MALWAKRLFLLAVTTTVVTGNIGAAAHEHHEEGIPEGEFISPEPIDIILWIHIAGMMCAFGIIFPIGMVLGIVRSRWHAPIQVLGTVIAVSSWFLGHAHGGRQFVQNIHASFASVLMSMLLVQVGLGAYLKLHLERGIQGKIRPKIVVLHGVLGKLMPLVSWIQMVFGAITALGFCRMDHTGQCLAHFIMGGSFIAYGILMTIMLLVGQDWLKNTKKSQEFWDSLAIASWGCVNTFTEHRWGHEWVHNDIQHTSMGVLWWCAGLLGLWLSKGKGGEPKRNVVPGMVIFITGWAMSAHPQHNPLSSMVHTVFGYTLMAAGLARIIEICFVLKDRPSLPGGNVLSWQYLTPYLLFASGMIFQAATEEQMNLVSGLGIDHVSYLLMLYSLAFLMFLFTNILIRIYINNPPPTKRRVGGEETRPNGHARVAEVARDTEQFELEGLISESEEEAQS